MAETQVFLINTNTMKPAVAPIALDYIAGALEQAGFVARIVDLCFAENIEKTLAESLAAQDVLAVGVTFRNSDDCFWPSAMSFVPHLNRVVDAVRQLTHAPIVIGGAGFSVFPENILASCGADYGIAGDGEIAFTRLAEALDTGAGIEDIPGLLWRTDHGQLRKNPPQYNGSLSLCPTRQWVDNPRYFREGGQGGVETKRGCDRRCVYCADPLSKGARARLRDPEEVADETDALLGMGVDVLHFCDCEFNVPHRHALAVCEALIRRGLGRKVRWYTYAAITDFSPELARRMREAGCVGVNFGADSAVDDMLSTYGRRHRRNDIAVAVGLCKEHGLRVMLDLLLGGPGETEETLRETIEFMKSIDPDCVGAALGVRVYPGTRFFKHLLGQGCLEKNPNLHRARGEWPDGDLLRPTFYIAEALGERPARLVKDIIGGDKRFFEPVDAQGLENYNYNDNQPLVEAIRNGARGAYWDILLRMRA